MSDRKTEPLEPVVKLLLISLFISPIGWVYTLLNVGVVGYTVIALSVLCYTWFNYWARRFSPELQKDSKSDQIGYSLLGSFLIVGDCLFIWGIFHFLLQ